MKSQGSLITVGLLTLAVGMAGCKKDEPPKPDPAVQAQSATTPPRHPPRPPQSRVDPQAMKDYRLDFCYYGTLSLREARDAYLASLGKDEPSLKKIPSFGVSTTGAPGAPGTPGAPAKVPMGAPPKPAASGAPAGAADAGANPPPRMDFALRLPHERNARACSAAVPLKDPPMGDVDAALAAFAPFAVELAKDITTAQQYYSREEYTKDAFAKGKELDKKLRDEFSKLDDLSGKLGASLEAWRKDHPVDTSKMEDSEKLSRAMIDDARDVLLLVVNKKADGDAWKTARDKLDKSIGAVKSFADGHPADNWSKIMTSAGDNYLKTLNTAKMTADKTFDGETQLTLISNFTGLVEARQRAATRAANPRPSPMPGPNVPAPMQAPVPTANPHP